MPSNRRVRFAEDYRKSFEYANLSAPKPVRTFRAVAAQMFRIVRTRKPARVDPGNIADWTAREFTPGSAASSRRGDACTIDAGWYSKQQCKAAEMRRTARVLWINHQLILQPRISSQALAWHLLHCALCFFCFPTQLFCNLLFLLLYFPCGISRHSRSKKKSFEPIVQIVTIISFTSKNHEKKKWMNAQVAMSHYTKYVFPVRLVMNIFAQYDFSCNHRFWRCNRALATFRKFDLFFFGRPARWQWQRNRHMSLPSESS